MAPKFFLMSSCLSFDRPIVSDFKVQDLLQQFALLKSVQVPSPSSVAFGKDIVYGSKLINVYEVCCYLLIFSIILTWYII